MKHLGYYILLLFIPLLGKAQEKGVLYKVKGDMLYITIERNMPGTMLDSALSNLGLAHGFADSLAKGMIKKGSCSKKYEVYSVDPKFITLKSPFSTYAQSSPNVFDLFIVEELFGENLSGNAVYTDKEYGFNRFKEGGTKVRQGTVVLSLPNHLEAQEVFVGGSFNNWNYAKTPMRKTADGWVVELGLKPGKHLYKFVVDGHWQLDPNNKRVEGDMMGNDNNALFVPNYTFMLKGHTDAKRVYVSSSFNDWKERELRMYPTGTGWLLNMYVPEGTHAYKFIVDGDWMLDPNNKMVRKDPSGNLNSFLAIGDTFYFELKGYTKAREVFVCGNFNEWKERELSMKRTPDGWELGYVLGGGQYQYKFIVDGHWMRDPNNPYRAEENGGDNSLLVVKPNYTFRYPHKEGVRDVRLSGSFNGWNETGYNMVLKNGQWQIALHLDKGKQLYKFIVNGEWVLDPTNPLWEQNEYGTGNSIIWMDEK